MQPTRLLQVGFLTSAVSAIPELPLKIETRTILQSHLTNIHIQHQSPTEGIVDFTYGSCEAASRGHGVHHFIGKTTSTSHDRLIWVIPEDIVPGRCISAWRNSTGLLVGRSERQNFDLEAMQHRRSHRRARRGVHMDNSTGVDVWGPWFDGVELLKNTEIAGIDAASAKNKNIAIVGAGMSGLMAYLCLVQQGMTNVQIIEAGTRIGGRVHTVYLTGGPFDYSYQEMGPMRLPTTITVGNDTFNISDHQLVFQLANEMNNLNQDDKSLSINFIPWYETSDNLPHVGGPPGMEKLLRDVNTALPCRDFCVEMATNMFKAHRKWIGEWTLEEWYLLNMY